MALRRNTRQDGRRSNIGSRIAHRACGSLRSVMPLSAGTRLGSYEIVAPLGAGGMGAVYRARDTKLGRAVAIKVILDEFASDNERIGRFEREAKMLAALNHPRIASLFGMSDLGSRDSSAVVAGRQGAVLFRRRPVCDEGRDRTRIRNQQPRADSQIV